MHVVKPECIRLERSDRRRLLIVPLAAAPVAIGIALSDFVAPVVSRGCAGARRVFPFGLRQQPIRPAGHFREPRDILLGFVPRHVHDRLGAASESGVRSVRASADRDACVPVVKGHEELGNGEGPGDSDLALGALVGEAALVMLRRSHNETAGGNHDHLGAVPGALAKRLQRPQRILGRGRKRVGPHMCQHVGPHGDEPIRLLDDVGLIDPPDQSRDDRQKHPAYQGLDTSSESSGGYFFVPAGRDVGAVIGFKAGGQIQPCEQPLCRFQAPRLMREPGCVLAARDPIARCALDAFHHDQKLGIFR